MKVKIQKAFQIPSVGVHRAVINEVVHKGETKTENGLKDQLTVVWQVEDPNADDGRLEFRQNLTNKVHPTSHFYKLIRAVGFAIDFKREDGMDFDTDCLIGHETWLDIRHTTRGGKFMQMSSLI